VIHAGVYYEPGSLKARLCVDGAVALYAYCDERRIEARRAGKVIVATSPDEVRRLDELERRGRANGVPGLERIGPDRLREIEPHAAGLAALYSPATGIVDFRAVAAGYAADVEAAGGTLHYGTEITGIAEPPGAAVRLEHADGTTEAARAVVCAGLWSDRLAVAAGGDPEPRIVPFRGAYLRLRPERSGLVRANIYPVPDPDLPFLGAHLTRTHTGEVLLGPTALFAGARDAYRLSRVRPRDLTDSLTWPGTWRLFRRWWRTGAREIAHALSDSSLVAQCRRYVPELRADDVERSQISGVRAQAVARDGSLIDDFVIDAGSRVIHVRNAPSPAATSSLALAEEICDRLEALPG
jgi:L-2-hydroxyglutarate oxidase